MISGRIYLNLKIHATSSVSVGHDVSGVLSHLGELGKLVLVHLGNVSVLLLHDSQSVDGGVRDTNGTLSAVAARVASISSVSGHAALQAGSITAHGACHLVDHAHEVVSNGCLSGFVSGLCSSQVTDKGVENILEGSRSSLLVSAVSCRESLSLGWSHIIPSSVTVGSGLHA